VTDGAHPYLTNRAPKIPMIDQVPSLENFAAFSQTSSRPAPTEFSRQVPQKEKAILWWPLCRWCGRSVGVFVMVSPMT